MKGAIARAQELVAADAGRLDAAAVREPGQRRGARAHHGAGDPRRLSRAASTALITGVGTGGHITGCARGAEEEVAEAQGVRGRADRVAGDLRRRSPGPHPIQGIGAGFIPKNLHIDCSTA